MKKLRVIITVSRGQPGDRDYVWILATKKVPQNKLEKTLTDSAPELLRDLNRLVNEAGR